jgi:hypothetical protein
MTSEKKIAANRNNARKSCGPRSAAGKRRVARNAWRHGLAAITPANTGRRRDIERMARAMCGDDADPLLFEQAVAIVESQIVLLCVRAEKVAVIERLRDAATLPLAIGDNRLALAKAKMQSLELAWDVLERLRARVSSLPEEQRAKLEREYEAESDLPAAQKPIRAKRRDEIEAMCEAIPDLARLDRYERRAWSRRRRAFSNFMRIKAQIRTRRRQQTTAAQPPAGAA